MKRTHHISSNFLLAYPVMLSMLGQVMTGVADSVMVGWTGAVPLAASSFANTFFSVAVMFGIGVSYAITPLVAEAAGQSEHGEAGQIARHGLVINLITGLVLTFAVLLVLPVMDLMGQHDEVVEAARPYLLIVAPSILPTMLFQTFRQFAEGLQRTRVAMFIVIGCNLINIFLNYLLIFGYAGFPALGLEGAAWATLVSRVIMGFAMAAYVMRTEYFRKFRFRISFAGLEKKRIATMLNIGLPAGTQFIMEGGAFGASAIMMGWLGAVPLAAHQIALNLATISYMTTSGLGAAATVKAGRYLGRRDGKNLRQSVYLMFWMAVVVMLLWAIVFIAGRHFLPAAYIDDPEVLRMAAGLMIIAALFQISDGLQVVCAGALRGIQDVKIPVLLIFTAYWVVGLPLGYYLSFRANLGPSGIWLGLLTGLTLTAVAMIVRFRTRINELLPEIKQV